MEKIAEEGKSLIVIGETSIVTRFEKEGLQPFIDEIKRQFEGKIYSTDTKKDRDEIKKDAYQIAKWKTAIDAAGKNHVAGKKAEIKVYDSERKRVRDILGDFQTELRSPLTVWEEEEKIRVADIGGWIDGIKSHDRVDIWSEWDDLEKIIEDVIKTIENLENVVINNDFQEFKGKSERLKRGIINKLKDYLIIKQKEKKAFDEKQIAEKERLKKEQEEREEKIKRDAIEGEKKKAEVKRIEQAKSNRQKIGRAQDETTIANRRAEEIKQANVDLKKRAEKDKQDAILNERKKVADRKAQETEAKRKREADKKHKSKFNSEALKCFVDEGLTEAEAKKVIVLIVQNKIKNITINY